MGYQLQFQVRPLPFLLSIISAVVGDKAATVLRQEINTQLNKRESDSRFKGEQKLVQLLISLFRRKGQEFCPILDLRLLNR